MRSLTFEKRLRLLCLTAASGSIPNLELAAASTADAGCLLTDGVLAAAAAAGHLHVCQWIWERGVLPAFGSPVLEAAAAGGRMEICAWLLDNGYDSLEEAAFAAARGGHVQLMEWLLRLWGKPLPPEGLVDVAAGCDLTTLQRLYRALNDRQREGTGQPGPLGMQQQQLQLSQACRIITRLGLETGFSWTMLEAAVQSPTPDWPAKVEWLEEQGCPQRPGACAAAASRPDAVTRLTWLRQRDYPLCTNALQAAADRGNLAAVQYLLAAGVMPDRDFTLAAAARGGHVSVLEALRAAGCDMEAQPLMLEAASSGELSVVAWAVEHLGGGEELTEEVFDAAAESGDLELLMWLRERGCPWDASTFSAAATTGNVAALEWLVEQGCPLPDYHMCYYNAISNDHSVADMLTLRCLRRLGCPWGDPFVVLNALFYFRASGVQERLRLLGWLRDEGCPLDWAAARRKAAKAGHTEIVQWLDEHISLQL